MSREMLYSALTTLIFPFNVVRAISVPV